METLILKKKVNAEKQIIVDLPRHNEGDEIEVVLVITSFSKLAKAKRKRFDMKKWADQWETDLGENVQSSDVESFTGRRF